MEPTPTPDEPDQPGAPPTDAPYRDATLPIADRVEDLLGRMTTDEKLGQLGSVWIFEIAPDGSLDASLAADRLSDGLGHVTRISGAGRCGSVDAARLANEVQAFLVEHTRLGIPAIVHEEICSGLMAREATVFPQAIGVSATFRPEHNLAVADAIRHQMRAMGAHQGLSPVLDICRDARWGRLEETYGEDPYLTSQMGIAFVQGLQGDDLRDGVIATAKHFVGYGASEGGMNWAPSHLGERELRDVHLRPFEAAVRVAGLQSIMNSYAEIDGVPCAANGWLFTDVLRGEWGFDGTVVSDYFAVRQLETYHRVAPTGTDAAALALATGIDVELPSTDCYGLQLASAIADALIPAATVDEAVRRVLTAKFRLGLFEHPYVDLDRVRAVSRPAHERDLAERVARESLVLLSNDGALPLRASVERIAVIGPNADEARHLMGDYSYVAHVEALAELMRSGQSELFDMDAGMRIEVDVDVDLDHVPTVLGALRSRLPGITIEFARGCSVLGDDRRGFDEAVGAAARSDVAVVVVGDKAGLTAGCTSGESNDVASLDLPGVQEHLVRAVAATGTPVILVLVAGRPIGSADVHAAAAAVIHAWLPGEHGAEAIADALTGAFSPGGKLPVSYPRSAGQLPVFYGHKRSGGRSHWKGRYVDLSNEPLYPFGHGLTYSQFHLEVEPVAVEARSGDLVPVSATIRNTGSVTADEVIQLYVNDPVASVTRPVLELQGFARVTLAPGEATGVTFHLAVDALGFTATDVRYRLEPGTVDLFVGSSSGDLVEAGSIVITGTPDHLDRAHTNRVDVHAPGTMPDRPDADGS